MLTVRKPQKKKGARFKKSLQLLFDAEIWLLHALATINKRSAAEKKKPEGREKFLFQ